MAGGIGHILRNFAAGLLGPSPAELLRARLAAAPLPGGDAIALPTVVFDLETTGLRPTRGDALVQIGAVRLEGGAEVGHFTTPVHPGRPIPAASTRYHGITDAMVAGAPRIPAAVGAFRDFCAGAVLVAHNAAFDMTVLLMAERAGAPALPNPMLCSLQLARWLDPAEPDLSLDGLCGRLGMVIEGRHQALGDARATAELWRRLLARAAARGATGLDEIRRRSRMAEAIAQGAERF
ncbi:3'-5' exonuclease [Falsiroseomonas sp. CW058]|uniref:3'-5' exonuclease n=1 Tax=Falsiroseomonas sp. CW058 TaxID=3388664 RepID=UPI003D314C33